LPAIVSAGSNVEAVGATSSCYTNDDDATPSRLHNTRPPGCICIRAHYRIIIMYAPLALAPDSRTTASQFPSPPMPVGGRLQRFMDPAARVIDKNASLPLGSRHTHTKQPMAVIATVPVQVALRHRAAQPANAPGETWPRRARIALGSDLQQVQRKQLFRA
jgi:hypothetical protein